MNGKFELEYHSKPTLKTPILIEGLPGIGDVQPIDEPSCYEFCELIIDILAQHKGKELITLGGIGLQKIPKKPKVFITGTNKSYVKTFPHASDKIYGVVGPIIGVTGVLLGVAQRKKIPAVALLAQTFA